MPLSFFFIFINLVFKLSKGKDIIATLTPEIAEAKILIMSVYLSDVDIHSKYYFA